MLKFSGWPRLTWGRVPRGARRGFLACAAGAGCGGGVQRRTCPSTTRRVRPGRRPALRPAAPQGTGGQSPHPRPPPPRFGGGNRVRGATRGVTPRQACPRPDGLGRNLRSKTRWFTGFCNSHQVSHFATFFIDARAKISVAESRKS